MYPNMKSTYEDVLKAELKYMQTKKVNLSQQISYIFSKLYSISLLEKREAIRKHESQFP